MLQPPLKPLQTLADIFGQETSFSPRVPFSGRPFLPPEPAWVLDAQSTGSLSIAGDTRTICTRAAASPRALALLELAGMPSSPALDLFETGDDYRNLLAREGPQGRRIAVQHLHPPDELPPETCWIDPGLLSFLNNKAHLGVMVPTEHLPARRLVSPDELDSLSPSASHPLVLKAATDLSTGAGAAVAICRSDDDIRNARLRFVGCHSIVVEEFLEIVHNLCLAFASDGKSVEYHGCSRQLTSDAGVYQASVFGPATIAPAEAVSAGFQIMREAASRGYRGFAGFDMAVLPDGRIAVLDLNFRLCASTPALLWYGALSERAGGDLHARFAVLRSGEPLDKLLPILGEAIDRRALFPLALYDPDLSPHSGALPIVRAMILGHDWDEVERHSARLAASGLRPKSA